MAVLVYSFRYRSRTGRPFEAGRDNSLAECVGHNLTGLEMAMDLAMVTDLVTDLATVTDLAMVMDLVTVQSYPEYS
jgi:hypothetical protein